jgi:hypothetical protein
MTGPPRCALRRALVHSAAGLLLLGTAAGHGMMTHPMPRNTRDWNVTVDRAGKRFGQHDHCNPPHGKGKGTPREETGSGQPCLWFSQGCVS